MIDTLTMEQDAIIRTVDKIAEQYDRRYWLDHAQTGAFPRSMWMALAEAGILGIAVPELYGGTGLGRWLWCRNGWLSTDCLVGRFVINADRATWHARAE
jgi:alkylation response protein AidB-like acyl-CoA dehydrogenase